MGMAGDLEILISLQYPFLLRYTPGFLIFSYFLSFLVLALKSNKGKKNLTKGIQLNFFCLS